MTGGRVRRGFRLFQMPFAGSVTLVSKYCAVSPVPGTLCARVPSGIFPSKPSLTVNARNTLADTPGLGR